MNIWQVIAGAAASSERQTEPSVVLAPRPCPFCGTDPPLAVRCLGRFMVACEADDCAANPQVSGATVEEAWAGWNRRT
jgi:hypothetical protein